MTVSNFKLKLKKKKQTQKKTQKIGKGMWVLEGKSLFFLFFFLTEKIKHYFNTFQVLQENKSLFYIEVQET